MTQHKISFLWLLAVCCLLTACGVDKNIKKGEKYLSLGEYYDAAEQFKQAYRKIPPKERDRRGQISALMASCYDHINFSAKAVAAYRNVVRYKQDNGETHLLLANNLMKSGSYKEAYTEYRIALDSLPGNTLAREGQRAATQAAQAKADGSQYTVKKMDIFNSRRADYSPMLAGDQFDKLYFTSTP